MRVGVSRAVFFQLVSAVTACCADASEVLKIKTAHVKSLYIFYPLEIKDSLGILCEFLILMDGLKP